MTGAGSKPMKRRDMACEEGTHLMPQIREGLGGGLERGGAEEGRAPVGIAGWAQVCLGGSLA